MVINMLIGRDAEIKFLDHYYALEDSQIVVVYGQKNIGKTTLLQAFAKGRPGHYYLARSASAREQRYQWASELREETEDDLPGEGQQRQNREGRCALLTAYPAYQEILQAFVPEAPQKQLIVLDEFHYMVKADDGFMSELVRFVEARRRSQPVMVVLSTSASGWVENSMVRKIGKAAFYLNGLLKVKELRFRDMCRIYPGLSKKDALETYAVLGGLPGLWKSFEEELDIRGNIIRHILARESRLHEEISVLMSEELREPAIYNTILAAMAGGYHKLNDIYLHTEFSRAKISVYLKNLMELELVEKVFSFETAGRANAQKGIYRIANPFVRFYFRFLYPHQSLLQSLSPEAFYDRVIRKDFLSFVESAYKRACREQMEDRRQQGLLPVAYTAAGEWIGKSGDLDMVARDGEGRTLVAYCSYEKGMTQADYEKVLYCAGKARIQPDYVYLYSAAGFDDKLCDRAAREPGLTLETL